MERRAEARSNSEEAFERGEARSAVVEVEGRRVLRIRWNTGKTTAAKLFGKYGKDGKPDFFRLLFGSIIGSLREQFHERGVDEFNRIRESKEFKESVQRVFDEMKSWFFNEVAPKYRIEPGDVFVITTEIDVDLETGEVGWHKDRSDVLYWIRSDKLQERCRELGVAGRAEVSAEEIERLRKEVESLRAEVNEWKSKYEQMKVEKEALERERAALRIEADTLKAEVEKLRKENEELRSELNSVKRKFEEIKKLISSG